MINICKWLKIYSNQIIIDNKGIFINNNWNFSIYEIEET